MSPVRLCVLVSGSGTILQAVLDAGVEVALVGSDRTCPALNIARANDVSSVLVERGLYGGFSESFERERYSRALAKALSDHEIDLVAMAGFGTIVTGSFHEAFPGRVLNTHPSLLPKHKGWHAVRSTLDAGESVSGCTVHVATEALDDGPILAQREVEVLAGDDEASLHERIKLVERALYPQVLVSVMDALSRGIEPANLNAEGEVDARTAKRVG